EWQTCIGSCVWNRHGTDPDALFAVCEHRLREMLDVNLQLLQELKDNPRPTAARRRCGAQCLASGAATRTPGPLRPASTIKALVELAKAFSGGGTHPRGAIRGHPPGHPVPAAGQAQKLSPEGRLFHLPAHEPRNPPTTTTLPQRSPP